MANYRIKVSGGNPYQIKVRTAAQGPTGPQGPQGEQGIPGAGYTLPIATDITLGGVKVGDNLTIDGDGVLSAGNSYVLPAATDSTLGGIIVGDNLTITANGVLSGVNSYTLPTATNSTLGGVIVGSGVSVNNGTISVNTNYLNNSTTNSTYSYSESSISGFNYAALTLTATGANSTNSVRNDWLANTGKFGNIQWILKPNTGIYNWTWGGIGLDANTTDATRPEMAISTNYSLNFGAGEAYGRGIGISPRDVYLKETYFSGPALPAKEWTNNSFLIKSYADGRYLLTANFTYANLTGTPTLSAVATSGAYSDLTGTPDLSVYLTTSAASSTYQPLGNYTTSADLTWSNITGKPTFAAVATSGSYNDLTNLPTLFDGSYTSLSNIPATFTPSAHTHTVSQITDFPSLATVATSGLYSDLTGTPDLSGYLTSSTAASTYLTISTAASTYATASSLSSYLTTSAAASTYQPIGSYATLSTNTFTGTQSLGGNIIDKPRLQSVRETKATPSIASNVLTLDLNAANFFAVSLNADITTLTISNVPTGVVSSLTLELTADGTARSVTWPASFKFPSGTAPTLTSTNGKKDVLVAYTDDDGTTWDIFVAGQNL